MGILKIVYKLIYMNIKEKLASLDSIFLKKQFLQKIIKLSWKKYEINDLIELWYISAIKKWEIYFNNVLGKTKNPYLIWWAYMDFKDFMFWGFDRYNKEWFTTQVSNIFTIYNLKYSRELDILWLKFKFKKIKKEFFYWKYKKMIMWKNIYFMDKERLFLEYIRDYIKYDNSKFVEIYKTLNKEKLEKYAKKYPIKRVILKLNKIKKCI